jgi:hypothetical protein
VTVPYRSAPPGAREELAVFAVADSAAPRELDAGMNKALADINERLAQGAKVKHIAQSSTGSSTIISVVFEYPADSNQERRHRP